MILMVSLTFMLLPVFAQDPGVPGGDPDGPVPIDGGIYILMALGLHYGIKSIRKNEVKKRRLP